MGQTNLTHNGSGAKCEKWNFPRFTKHKTQRVCWRRVHLSIFIDDLLVKVVMAIYHNEGVFLHLNPLRRVSKYVFTTHPGSSKTLDVHHTKSRKDCMKIQTIHAWQQTLRDRAQRNCLCVTCRVNMHKQNAYLGFFICVIQRVHGGAGSLFWISEILFSISAKRRKRLS